MLAIADGVSCHTTDLRLGPGFWLPARSTALSCGDGRIVLVSPLPMPEGVADALDARGKVAWVVAPNRLHHLHVASASARWPEAEVLAASGVESKLPTGQTSKALEGAVFGADVEALTVSGAPALSETVLLHKPSRTLLVTDLVFNVRAWRGLLTPVILTFVGARGRFAQSRAVRFMVKDRAAVAASFEAILAMDFDRVVMAHGEVLDTGGKDALAAALGWARRAHATLPARR